MGILQSIFAGSVSAANPNDEAAELLRLAAAELQELLDQHGGFGHTHTLVADIKRFLGDPDCEISSNR